MSVEVTYYSDPACPWAYSVSPALVTLRWRYGDQLDWRLVTIGLTERAEQYLERGYTPARSARAYIGFRRYGMPFTAAPRRRIAATSRACRALVAVRVRQPGLEFDAFRALQLGWFTTGLVLDEDPDIEAALATVPGLDARAAVAAIDDQETVAAYEADKDEARAAAGSPTEFQGKARNSDGAVRYTAPSLVFSANGRRLEAGGFQPLEAYDVLIANLDPTLERTPPAETPLEVLERFPGGLTTQEVATVMARGNDAPDRAAAEAALIELVAEAQVERRPLGDDAMWLAAGPGAKTAERRSQAAEAV